MAQGDNPALPAGLRVFSAFVIVVLLLGSALFFAPGLVKPRWPWALTPFNARFLGSFYIAEMVVMSALLLWNRWSPARMILMMAFAFTLVVTVASAIHLDHFDFHRKNGWLWFIVYVGSALISGWFLWRARGTPPVASAVSGSRWRGMFLGETLVFALYGLGLLAAPSVFAAFWPWPIDVFHGQVYSAIFLAAAAGTWLLVRNAPREELVVLGLAQLTIGALSIVGLVVTDAAVKRLDWTASGTWAWIVVFAAIALTGAAKVRGAMAQGGA
jgi:hypothetical protein